MALRHRELRTLGTGIFLVVAFAAVDNVAIVFLARDVLQVGSSGYGFLLGSYGTAMLLVSLAVAAAAKRLSRSRVLLLVGVTCTGAGLAVTGLAPSFAVALAAVVTSAGQNPSRRSPDSCSAQPSRFPSP